MFSQNQKYSVSFLLLFFCIASSGCQPLRQKFTRTKKVKADKFIPILQPVEYEGKSVSAEKQYNHYYLIYRVWEKELMQGLDQSDSDKRLKESLLQVITQLEEMNNWVSIDKKQRLGEVISKYRSLDNYFEKPVAMRNVGGIESKLRTYERIVRKELKTELVFYQEN